MSQTKDTVLRGIRIKNVHNFTIAKELDEEEKPSNSAHDVTIYYKNKHLRQGKKIPYYLKPFPEAQLPLAEEEAFLGEIYFFLIGEHAPKTRKICENGLIGNISKGFIGFKSLMEDRVPIEKLIDMKLGVVLACCYIMAEYDLHIGNLGVADGLVRKIDHDESARPLTCKYKRRSSFDLYSWWVSHSQDEFPIDVEDILEFP